MAATSSGLTYFGPVFNALSGLDGRQLPSAWHLLYAYATNDIIFACANYNAQAVAQVPLRLYTNRKQQTFESRGVSRAAKAFLAGHGNTRITKALRESEEVEEITEHPLLDLLAQDNDGLNGYKFLLLTQTYLEVVGRAYWGKDRIGLRGVSAFEMYPPQRTMPVRNGVGDVLSFKTMPVLQGQWEDLDKDDVIDFCNVSLDDPWGWGHSPAAACYRKGLLTGKFTQWMNDIVDNRARIDGVFVPADDIGSEMAGKAEAEFKQRFGGGGRGGVWFSPTKGTFVPTTYTPTELGPIEYDKNAVSAICRAFGIPEPLIAANESTYANMEQAKRWHGENTIRSRLLLLEQRLNDLLIPEFDERLFLAFDNPVAEDKEFDLQRKTFAAGQRAMTLNEIREAGGLPPSGDAAHDELPEEPEEEPEETTKDEGEDTRKAITDAVLRINKAVFAGELTTAAGIAALLVAHAIPEEQARGLVVHVEKADTQGHWVTIDGTHVFINSEGVVAKGPKELVGTKPGDSDTRHEKVSSRAVKDENGAGRKSPHKEPQATSGYKPAKESDLNGRSIHLWHGTTKKAWEKISKELQLQSGERGKNAAATVDDARQYPEDTGAEVLVLVRADTQSLSVDPNDQIGDTVKEGLFPDKGYGSSATLGKHEIVAAFDVSGAKEGYEKSLQRGDFERAKRLGVKQLFKQSGPADSGATDIHKAISGAAPADYDTLTEPLRQYFREQAEAEKAALAAKEDADAKAKRRAERTALLALLLLGFWRHWAAEAQTATLETIGGPATGNAEAMASQTQARADFWAERINQTTFGRLDNAMAGAETDEAKQQAIDAVLAEAIAKRAPAIAEDQAYKAALLGQRLAAVASGVVVSKMWIAYPGACPVCEKMDGNTVALDQPFVTLLGPMDEPGSVHPSCRCTMLLLTDAGEVIQPRAT